MPRRPRLRRRPPRPRLATPQPPQGRRRSVRRRRQPGSPQGRPRSHPRLRAPARQALTGSHATPATQRRGRPSPPPQRTAPAPGRAPTRSIPHHHHVLQHTHKYRRAGECATCLQRPAQLQRSPEHRVLRGRPAGANIDDGDQRRQRRLVRERTPRRNGPHVRRIAPRHVDRLVRGERNHVVQFLAPPHFIQLRRRAYQ